MFKTWERLRDLEENAIKTQDLIKKRGKLTDKILDILSKLIDDVNNVKLRVSILEETHHNKKLLNGKTKDSEENSVSK